MLYRSKARSLIDEIAISKTEKAITRTMCGLKLIEKRSTQEPTNLLGLENALGNGLKELSINTR